MTGFLGTFEIEIQSSITTCKSLTLLSCCFSALGRRTLPLFLQSTKSISYRNVLRCRRSSNTRFSFKRPPCNWGRLSPSSFYWWTNWKFWKFLLPGSLFPYKWNAMASERHKLYFKGCFGLSSNVKQFRVWKFSGGLCDKLSLQPAGTFFSKAANTVKIVNL